MDLNLLKTFDMVMKTRSVNQAANALGISAPAISQSLNRLRDQYQDPLFIRQGRGITPTTVAIELYAEIQAPLQLLLNGSRSRQLFEPDSSRRTFHLSSHKDLDLMIVPPLVTYRDRYAPNVRLNADKEHSDESHRQTDLRMRRADLIITTVPLDEHGYHNQSLFDVPLVMVCRKDHPRIHGEINPQQFFNERHLLWGTKRLNQDIVDSLAVEPQPSRDIAYRTDSICNAIMMAAQTDWICVTSEWHAAMLGQNVQILPMPFELSRLPVYMTWHHSQQSDSGHQWLKSAVLESTNRYRINRE
ncbi:LysR substrate-binding domain-containing protein [Vibrio ostreicida]|uniref:LysR substrate-binding domain-containing protein n=1 Tax=Vibrio ostreicida TaxID=526588 RepID=A0ABT8BYA7_9VIBR|nr:LysR substrate-binding domain-containing protein [Vibrio ostreicida]MDN3612046.1 LysR substrate-binding domain-containing protein [Vibrio ostreicida]NPD08781.1 LysR family transcriptional regulator [Vibrio ostreicida]